MTGPLPGEPVRPAKSGWLARRVSMAVRWDEALRLGRGGAETMPPSAGCGHFSTADDF